MTSFPKWVRELRGEKTQRDFATTLDVRIQLISDWETGAHRPSTESIHRLARYSGISADAIHAMLFEASTPAEGAAAAVAAAGEAAAGEMEDRRQRSRRRDKQ